MTDRKIYRCGLKVYLIGADAYGIIDSVRIKYSLVVYSIKYFQNGEYRIGEFSKDEFMINPEDIKKTIGFKQIST